MEPKMTLGEVACLKDTALRSSPPKRTHPSTGRHPTPERCARETSSAQSMAPRQTETDSLTTRLHAAHTRL